MVKPPPPFIEDSDERREKVSTSVSYVAENKFKFNINEDFLFWFSGFTDGEGNFSITLDRGYIIFRFKINLHIDDLEVINIIKSKLNIGRIIV